jgi:predicted Rossmann fold nucleotide-binding protein DprA/Smf involved in DNA uptake
VQIVSGAARGVDETAMVTCAAEGGTALGVVGESLLRLSTRREFRTHIVENRLALISSYDPEAPFTVSNAMGRNRWIYALADRGLVVACSEGRGGTWTGAIEALRHGVPVFVKTGNPARPGNEALLRQGAQAAPDDLADLMALPAATHDVSPAGEPDVYVVAAPFLLAALRQPSTAKELSAALQLTPGQVKAWLARLIDEGKAVKTGARFTVAPDAPERAKQISLLDA